MTTAEVPISSDAYVRQDAVTANTGGLTFLTLTGAGGGEQRHGYVYFPRPFPLGVTVEPTYLDYHQRGGATGGSRTLTVQRIAAPGFKESTINYSNKPTVVGATASVTQGNSATDGRLWRFDITALLQEVADGAEWYGIRISSNNTTNMGLYSSESDVFQPGVIASWSDKPQAPTVLSPSNGRAVSIARPTLRFDFTDTSGDMTMLGYRVLMNLGGPDAVTPDYDSGDVTLGIPEHLVPFDVAAAADWWWAVETIDGSGLRSDLSVWVNFTRTAKPAVAIVNPSGFVTESTPPLIATVTGGTQSAYQWFITDPVDTNTVLWTTGKVSTADLSVTVPELDPPLLSPNGEYGLLRRTWDDVSRESTPGDPTYVDTFTTFTFDLTTDVDPVASLTVTVVDGAPTAVVNWPDASAADSYTIVLDGVAYVANLDPADAIVSAGLYSWPLGLVAPLVGHVVSVLRNVGGETSDDNPEESFSTNPKGLWLSTLDGLHSVSLAGDPGIRWQASEISVLRKPVGAKNPVLITQAVYGREGATTDDVMLTAYANTTLAEAVAEWDAITDRDVYPRGTDLALTVGDTTMRAFIWNTVRGVLDTEFQAKIPASFSVQELR